MPKFLDGQGVTDLTKQYDDRYAKQSIIAPKYDSTATYALGDVVIHDGKIYKCISAIETAEAWNAAHWALTDLAEVAKEKGAYIVEVPSIGIQTGALGAEIEKADALRYGYSIYWRYYKGNSHDFRETHISGGGYATQYGLSYNPNTYELTQNSSSWSSALKLNVASGFSTSDSYAIGDLVWYSNELYRCVVAHTGAWDATHFQQTTINDAIKTKQNTLVSGSNIKTINNESLLGSGNISIETEAMTQAEVDMILQFGGVVDPILANNSWETIRAVCEAGQAGNYWSLGDTKTDVGTDGNTRTFRICDMQGLYGKHVVFEQVELETLDYVWNPTSNIDSDGAYSDYAISNMRTTHLPAILLKYSSELQSSITNTTYKVATNGNNGTLLELTDKLFIPAEREILASRYGSRLDEWDALTRYALYTANDTANFRKKYKFNATSTGWWLRSAVSGSTSSVCIVYTSGNVISYDASRTVGVAPCFSF